MGHRHAIYINVLQGMLMYIACLCPNLVSVHFYAIPILHFKFPKFFIYLSPLKTIYKDIHFQFEVDFTFNDIKVKKVRKITSIQKMVVL